MAKNSIIKYKGKDIVITKDLMQAVSGVMLVLLSLILSGFFAFVSVGFDISKVLTWGFLISYCITLGTMYLCFFGMYVIREGRNKNKPSVVQNNQARKDFRDMIVSNKKLETCENWLKIYNYARKIEIHRDNIMENYRKLKLVPPQKELDHNSRKYLRQDRKYQKQLERKEDIKKQLEYVEIHEQIIQALKSNNLTKAEELKKQLDDKDAFRSSKIKWREVYFNDLFNSATQQNSNTIFYNKGKAIFDNVKIMLLLGVCSTFITTSMILQGNEVTIYTIISILSNIIMLCSYAVMGIRVADNVMFNVVLPANENKLTICDLFKEDDERLGGKWLDLDALDEDNAEEEAEEDQESENKDT